MLEVIFTALALAAAVLAVVVALQPAAFRIVRSATIAAPPDVVFGQVNDLRKWEAWSPWARLDREMQRTYEGPPAGTGAVAIWAGNSEAGQGRLTIVESQPSDLIRLRLEFVKPFACTNSVVFTFKPEGDGTVVTWSMAGTNNFVAKAIGLFMKMDKVVGTQFEAGLENLRSVSAPEG